MNNRTLSNVVPITSGPGTQLSVQLQESAEAYHLAETIYVIDQRLGRAPMGCLFERLTPQERESYVTRAAIAIRLGDQVKAIAVAEHAALAIVSDVTRRIRTKSLGAGDPETAIGLHQWRRIGKVAVLAGLEYLGGVARIRA